MIFWICCNEKERCPYVLQAHWNIYRWHSLGFASEVSKRKWANKVREYGGHKIGHKLLNKEAGCWKHGVYQYCFLYFLYFS